VREIKTNYGAETMKIKPGDQVRYNEKGREHLSETFTSEEIFSKVGLVLGPAPGKRFYISWNNGGEVTCPKDFVEKI
jgi:hypothetical protein